MDDDELLIFGNMVTKHRLELRQFGVEFDAAVADELQVPVDQVSTLDARMTKGYFGVKAKNKVDLEEKFEDVVPVGLRKRGSRRPKLQIGDKIRIVHKALVDKITQQEIAKEYRISSRVVSHIVTKASKNRNLFQDILEKNEDTIRRREAVMAYV